ncbi:class I SAM-dependent methyltransferase [Labrys monachus]|uniref:SAM-dependent methyltransferase n=1 Tax=Labrys monachus TaxID=217067 RepID=A0ABU0FD68_9HYPH|nr:class I SAM-dependent methyltransferase [Labrys monachus]MDQ0392544.1 SAM-dependent methyltransferase [Labrys monachus]
MTATQSPDLTQFAYQGDELDAFAQADNWKSYWSSKLRPLAGDKVIEVGAGIGGSTKYLCGGSHSAWLCLDPDPKHAEHLRSLISAGTLPPFCKAACGVLSDLDAGAKVDTIFYIDVLEHIEDDEGEIRKAMAYLEPGGRIVVLSPAFNVIFSNFDRAVGHFRRYRKSDAGRLTPDGLVVEQIFYLDCMGFVAALANRLFLRTSTPSAKQVLFWDRCLVPISRILDRGLGQLFGKTIVMVWKRQ